MPTGPAGGPAVTDLGWEDFRAANRANWEERTGIHLRSRLYDVEGWLGDGRGPRANERDALGDVSGLTLLHLQCHIGLDTLSWARAGATVTGLDFSPAAVAAAQDLSRRAGLDDRSRFVCADVYDAAGVLGGATFDIVYVSIGALCWLPSVERWAAQVAAALAPGGRLYLHESHPLAFALADERLEVDYPYFETAEPCSFDSDSSYSDGDAAITSTRNYQWNHGIGETVTSIVHRGLQLDWLQEHPWTLFARFPWLVPTADGLWVPPPGQPCPPLSFSLLAHRPADWRG
jgi:SAM-dependent methyltransferase